MRQKRAMLPMTSLSWFYFHCEFPLVNFPLLLQLYRRILKEEKMFLLVECNLKVENYNCGFY